MQLLVLRFNFLSTRYSKSKSKYFNHSLDDYDQKAITKVAKEKLLYRKISLKLGMSVEEIKHLPLDDFLVVQKEMELIIAEDVKQNSLATQIAMAKIINQIFRKGGENNDGNV